MFTVHSRLEVVRVQVLDGCVVVDRLSDRRRLGSFGAEISVDRRSAAYFWKKETITRRSEIYTGIQKGG